MVSISHQKFIALRTPKLIRRLSNSPKVSHENKLQLRQEKSLIMSRSISPLQTLSAKRLRPKTPRMSEHESAGKENLLKLIRPDIKCAEAAQIHEKEQPEHRPGMLNENYRLH